MVVVVVGVPSGGLGVGAVWLGGLARVGVFACAVERVGGDVVEDVAHQRCRGLGAVATLVDHGQYEIGRVGVGAERDEPGVGREARLVRGGSRLAGEVPRGREALEVPVRGAVRVRDHPFEPLEDGRVVGRGDVHVPGHPRHELLDDPARQGIDDRGGDLGGVARSAVGEGRIGHRLLDGRQDGLALPEGHLDVVAGEPRRGIGERLGRLGVQLGPEQVAVDTALRLPREVDAGDGPLPVGGRLVLDRRVPERAALLPELVAQVVEERVTRYGQRAADVVGAGAVARVVAQRAPGVVVDARCRAPRDLVVARVVVRRARLNETTWSAAVAVTSLKVDPGVYWPSIA